MNRTIFLTGTLFGLLAVILGAFGAHGLEKAVSADAVRAYETGVRYQMYHALLLLLLGGLRCIPEKSKRWVFYFIVMGILLFSFSIYLLSTRDLTGYDFRSIGFLTPLGGMFLIFGWGLLAYLGYWHFDKGAPKQ